MQFYLMAKVLALRTFNELNSFYLVKSNANGNMGSVIEPILVEYIQKPIQ